MTFLGRYNNQARICRTFGWITFFTFWLAASAYGLPIQFDASNVINLSSANGREARSGGNLNPLGSNGPGGSYLLYESLDSVTGWPLHGASTPLSTPLSIPFFMPFAAGLSGLDAEGTILESLDGNNGDAADIRGREWYTHSDADAMADFLAGIDFLTADWHANLDHSPVATHEAPASPAPAIVRRNPRECLQGNHDPKRGVQESLCTEGGGLAGSGVRSSGGGSSGSSAAFLAGAGGASGNSRNVIGVGDGIGGGGGGAGGAGGGGGGGSNNSGSNGSVEDNSGGGTGNNGNGAENEGGDRGDDSPGGSSGIDNGGAIGQGSGGGAGSGNGPWDQSGNGGSEGGGPAEVRPVPEPASLALLALGFAGMCFVRSRGREGANS